jgi:hypothetical protein
MQWSSHKTYRSFKRKHNTIEVSFFLVFDDGDEIFVEMPSYFR